MDQTVSPSAVSEHVHTRRAASLFDISDLGQVRISHPSGYGAAAHALEALVPADLLGLGEKRQCYTVFTNPAGGIESDAMIAHRGDDLIVTLNAATKSADLARLHAGLEGCVVEDVSERAFFALQGPLSAANLDPLAEGCDIMQPADLGLFSSDFGVLWVSRTGYTGADGFEISVEPEHAGAFRAALLACADVAPAGAAARGSLRMEAGFCAYGLDIDSTVNPVEAALSHTIAPARRSEARAGGFPGADAVLRALKEGVPQMRVGLRLDDGMSPGGGAQIYASADGGDAIGRITSSAPSPIVGATLAMGYVAAAYTRAGTALFVQAGGSYLPAEVQALPFLTADRLSE